MGGDESEGGDGCNQQDNVTMLTAGEIRFAAREVFRVGAQRLLPSPPSGER